MLSVILTILKIIGITLAVLVGLILLIVLLVGFVPIRYKASALYPYEGELNADVIAKRKREHLMSRVKAGGGETDDETEKKALKLKADAVVSWLLHIVHVSFKMDDTGVLLTARLFGLFKIYSNDPETVKKKEEKRKKKEEKRRRKEEKKKSKEEKKKLKENKNDKNDDNEIDENNVININNDNNVTEVKESGIKEIDKNDGPGVEEKCSEEKTEIKEESGEVSRDKDENPDGLGMDYEDDDDEEEESGIIKKKNKIVEKLHKIYDKIAGIKKKVDYVKKTYDDKRVQRGINYAKQKLFLIIKRMLPKKLKGYVAYGMEDPAVTGYITGAASLFMYLYAGHLILEPDFENKRLEADVKLKGNIIIAMLVIPAAKVWFNKDIKYIRRKVDGLKNV